MGERDQPFLNSLPDHLVDCHPLLSIATAVKPSASLPAKPLSALQGNINISLVYKAIQMYFGFQYIQLLLQSPKFILMLTPQII